MRFIYKYSLAHARGFSIYDTIVTLAISSVLGVGAVGLHSVVKENNMAVGVNTMIGHLNLARSEAIRRGMEVVMCPTRDGVNCDDPAADQTWWTHGYLLYADANNNGRRDADEPVIRVEHSYRSVLAVKTSKYRSKVTYQPTGLAGGSTITFAFCDNRGPAHARYVTVQNAGRARVSRTTTSDTRCA